MWYFIVIGILVIGISLIILGNIDWDYEKHKFMWKHDSVFRITGWSIFIPTVITFVIMTSCVVDAHMNLPAKQMTDEKIIEYVMDSPENTNPSVLDSMLKSNKVQPD